MGKKSLAGLSGDGSLDFPSSNAASAASVLVRAVRSKSSILLRDGYFEASVTQVDPPRNSSCIGSGSRLGEPVINDTIRSSETAIWPRIHAAWLPPSTAGMKYSASDRSPVSFPNKKLPVSSW